LGHGLHSSANHTGNGYTRNDIIHDL
jgi:hypothetical protein